MKEVWNKIEKWQTKTWKVNERKLLKEGYKVTQIRMKST